MSLGDYIVLAIVLLCVVAAFVYMYRRKKKGRCIGCGGDCSSCAYNMKR